MSSPLLLSVCWMLQVISWQSAPGCFIGDNVLENRLFDQTKTYIMNRILLVSTIIYLGSVVTNVLFSYLMMTRETWLRLWKSVIITSVSFSVLLTAGMLAFIALASLLAFHQKANLWRTLRSFRK